MKMVDEEFKLDVREDIRAHGITALLLNSLPGIEVHVEDGGGGVED